MNRKLYTGIGVGMAAAASIAMMAWPTKARKRRAAMKALGKMPSVTRTEYALALLRERDAEKAARIEARFDALVKRYPYPVDAECERELLRRAQAAAENANP